MEGVKPMEGQEGVRRVRKASKEGVIMLQVSYLLT
jgi:hypothetical protein